MSTTNAALSQLIAIDPSKKQVIEFEAKVGDGNTDLTVVLYPTARGDSFRVQLVTDSLGMGKVVVSAPYQPNAASVTPFAMIESQNVAVRFEFYDDPSNTDRYSGVYINGELALDTTSIITSRWGSATEAQVILQNASTGDAYTSSLQRVVVGSVSTPTQISTSSVTIFDPNDPYAENVVLYMDFEGGDGNVVATPDGIYSTAILDKSTYAHPIGVISNFGALPSLVQDSFAPVSTYACALNQTLGTFFRASTNSELDFTGVNKWTIEVMVKIPAIGADMIIVDKDGSYGLHASSYQMGIAANGTVWLALQDWTQHGAGYTLNSSLTVPVNEWVHIAAVRDGSNYHLFVDGTGTTGTSSYELVGNAGGGETLQIGAMLNYQAWSALPFVGEMDNLRITRNVARYTSDFSITFPSVDGSNTTTITTPVSSAVLTGTQANVVVNYTTISTSAGVSAVSLFIDKTAPFGMDDYGIVFNSNYLKSGSYTFQIDTTKLANGTHTLIASTEHNDGSNTVLTYSTPVTFTVSNVVLAAPTATITHPIDGDTGLYGTSSVAGLVTAEAGIASYSLTLDGTSLGSSSYSQGYPTTLSIAQALDLGSISQGAHVLVLSVTDTKARTATATVNFTTVLSIPAVSITAPDAGSTQTGYATVRATATDSVGVSKVEFYVEGTLVGTATSAPYTASWNTATSTNGNHTVTAKAYSVTGGTATATETVVVSNVPSIVITAPSTSVVVGGTIVVTTTPADNTGIASVVFTANGTPFATVTTAPYSAALDTKQYGNGNLVITATVVARSGLQATANVTVVVNNSSVPTVSFAAPLNNASISGVTTITVNASDSTGIASVQLLADAEPIAILTKTPYTIQWDSSLVADGAHTLTAAVVSGSNATASAAINVTVANGSNAGSVVVPPDAYFNNVVLLIQANTTLGSSTILDSSRYAHQLFSTAVGLDNTQSLFSKESIKITPNASSQISMAMDASVLIAGDFTYEFWIYSSSNAQQYDLLRLGTSVAGEFSLFMKNGSVYAEYGTNIFNLGAQIPKGSWVHVAFTRSAKKLNTWVGGQLVGSITLEGALGSSGNLSIGSGFATQDLAPVYLSEIRLTNGVARYTQGFDTPATTFANFGVTDSYWNQVSLMIHTLGVIGSNQFKDTSNNASVVTTLGATELASSPNSPGGCAAQFNGQNTTLTTTITPSSGLGAFTLECFIQANGALDSFLITSQSALRPAVGLSLRLSKTGSLSVVMSDTGVTAYQVKSAAGVIAMDGSKRQHIAVTRNANNLLTLWVDGASVATGVCATSPTTLPAFKIGSYDGGSFFYQGLMDEIRFTDGAARYTTAFTPYAGLAPTLEPAPALQTFYSVLTGTIADVQFW